MKLDRRGRPALLCLAIAALYVASPLAATSDSGSGAPPAAAGVAAGAGTGSPVTTVPINATTAYPLGVTTDASGNVWFAEDNLDSLAEFFPSNGTSLTFAIPTPHHLMWVWYMVFDAGGNLWFSDESQQLLWRFDPASGTFANYTAGTAYPMVLHYDRARGRMWFTSLKTGQVGYFSLSGGKAVLGAVANLSAPIPGSGVSGIAVDTAGNVYVAESFQAKIVELAGDTLSVMRTWSLPAGSQPVGLALDPGRGRLWFTDHGSSFFGYVGLNSSAVVEFPTSLYVAGGGYSVSLPYWILVSSAGDVWFNEHFANRIARFDPATSQLTEFEIPTNNSSPLMLSADDQRGEVWFTEFAGNALGVVDENSTLGASVNTSVSRGTAGPSLSLTSTSSPVAASLPTVSATAQITGAPQPGFEVTVTPQGGGDEVSLTAYRAGPGNYTAAVCYRYEYFSQCGYLAVTVPPAASVLSLLYAVYAAVGLAVVVLALVLLRGSRKDRVRRLVP